MDFYDYKIEPSVIDFTVIIAKHEVQVRCVWIFSQSVITCEGISQSKDRGIPLIFARTVVESYIFINKKCTS